MNQICKTESRFKLSRARSSMDFSVMMKTVLEMASANSGTLDIMDLKYTTLLTVKHTNCEIDQHFNFYYIHVFYNIKN